MARLRLPVRLRAAARRAAGDQRGITLVELLTSMAILGFVVASLGTLLVSGQKAEIDLNERFQAQTNARLALDLFRREVHNACDATVSSPSTITLYALANEPNYTCNVVRSTWCVVLVSTGRYALYRKPGGACDAAGTKRADYLTTSTVFAKTPGGQTLPTVGINLPVDTKTASTSRSYHLRDNIALRNALRT